MWTTLDDQTLSIEPAALRQLARRHRTSGMTDLVRRTYRSSLLAATRRALGQLARSAYLSGSARSSLGRQLWLFTAQYRGRSFTLAARSLGDRHYTLVAVRPAESTAEYSDSYGHRVVQNLIIDTLLQQGAQLATDQSPLDQGIRDNRRQVAGPRGTPAPNIGVDPPQYNVPDISYIARGGQRVNIEIDTVGGNNDLHLQRLGHGDPDALHIGYVVDERGQIVSRRVYDPAAPNQIRDLPLEQNIAIPSPRVTRAQAGRSQIPPRPTVTVRPVASFGSAPARGRQPVRGAPVRRVPSPTPPARRTPGAGHVARTGANVRRRGRIGPYRR